MNYYPKFLKNVSAVLKPLYELLQSCTSWHWGLSQQRAFEASKALLQSSKVLVHYNSRLPLVLRCDDSPYGIGAVLSHRKTDGSDRPIAFASRTLAPAEKRYAQIEREGPAIMFGVTNVHKYVYGRDFDIQTDHMPLLGLMSEDKLISPLASARIQRWALHWQTISITCDTSMVHSILALMVSADHLYQLLCWKYQFPLK